MKKLLPREIELLIEICDNYFEDEIPGSQIALVKIKSKLQSSEELELSEISLLKQCIDQETSDFEYGVENNKEFKLAMSILKKLECIAK